MDTGNKKIYIELSPKEAYEFAAKFEESGYQVIHADEPWIFTGQSMEQRSRFNETKEAAGNMLLMHDSREIIDRYEAAEEIRRHDAGEEWNDWAVAVCTSQGCVSRMKNNGIAVIGYEKTEQDRLYCDYVVQDLSAIDEMFLEEVFCRFHKLPLTVKKTERTIIREFAMCDFDDMYQMYQQPHMTDYIDGLLSKDQERACQKAYIETGYRFYGYGMWVVIHRESLKLIGRAGVENTQSCDSDEVELGYAVSVPFQNKGYATEVCHAIAELCFDRFEMNHIIARVNPRNIYSAKVLQKLGFTIRNEGNIAKDEKEDLYELRGERFS